MYRARTMISIFKQLFPQCARASSTSHH